MRFLANIFFVFFVATQMCSQAPKGSVLDSLLLCLSQKQSDTSKAKLYYKVSAEYLNIDERKSDEYREIELEFSKKIHYDAGLCYYYYLRAVQFNKHGNYKEAIINADKSLEIYKNKKVKEKKVFYSSLYSKSFALGSLNEFESAKKLLLYSLRQKSVVNKGKFYFLLGSINSRQFNFHTAIENFDSAYVAFQKDHNYYSLNLCFAEISDIYIKTHQLSKALQYINLAIEIVSKDESKRLTQVSAILLVKKAEIYNKMKLFSKALPFAKQSVSDNIRIGNKDFISNSLYQLAESYYGLHDYKNATRACYDGLGYNDVNANIDLNYMLGKIDYALKNYDDAVLYLTKALTLFELNENHQNEIQKDAIYNVLSQSEYAQGNYMQAYNYFKEKHDLEMSSLEYEKESRINELQTRFDVVQKDISYKNLTIVNQKKEIDLKRNQNFSIILAIVLFSTFILLLLVYLGYLNNKKKNELLNKKNIIIQENNAKLIEAQYEIRKNLLQKEVLLKEIHHRVKNNMQIILSLLSIQAKEGKNESIADFLEKGQTRIVSMSLIHQSLYENNRLDSIDFHEYLQQLIENLKRALGLNNQNITFIINSNDLFFDIQTAIPLGLIINELLSNSFKHAFQNREKGVVTICIQKINAIQFELIYSDDGVGYESNIKSSKSVGLDLVQLLVKQLKGTLLKRESKGTKYEILFQEIIA